MTAIAANSSFGTSVAAPRSRASRDELAPAADRDEEVARAGRGASRSARPVISPEPSSSPSPSASSSSTGSGSARLASASRATTRSSNGSFSPPISWPCSCPLPAITTTSPGSASPTARAIAARRSGSISTFVPAPWRMSWMIASGCSLRGLSEVTTTTSARSAAILPISGRLPRSRSPPAPKTTSTRPLVELARRPQHVVERVGRVRVVDEHGEGLALVDGLEAAGHARRAPAPRLRSRPRPRRAGSPPRPRRGRSRR